MDNKMIINLKKGTCLENFQNGDILMYDAVEKNFYRVTPEVFFDKYEKKLNDLLKKYDEKYNALENDFKGLKNNYKDFASQIKESNQKLIDFVKKDLGLSEEAIDGNE